TESRELLEVYLQEAIKKIQTRADLEKRIALEETKTQADVLSKIISNPNLPSLSQTHMPIEQKTTEKETPTSSTHSHGSHDIQDNKPMTQATSNVDADTSNDTKQSYNVRRIFTGIGCNDPSDHFYRLNVFDKVDIKANPKDPFALSNPPPDATL